MNCVVRIWLRLGLHQDELHISFMPLHLSTPAPASLDASRGGGQVEAAGRITHHAHLSQAESRGHTLLDERGILRH